MGKWESSKCVDVYGFFEGRGAKQWMLENFLPSLEHQTVNLAKVKLNIKIRLKKITAARREVLVT